jgi:hypothetical protein
LAHDLLVRGDQARERPTRRSSEREPADSLRDQSNGIGGWLPSLTFAFGDSNATRQENIMNQHRENPDGKLQDRGPQSSTPSATSDCPESPHPATKEMLLLFLPAGMRRTLIPERYLALALTSRRLILKDLGSALKWFLFFGLIGVLIGKSQARKTGETLRESDRWLPAQGDRELPLDRIDALAVRQSLIGQTVLAITTQNETDEYTFDGLNSSTAQNFIDVYRRARTPPAGLNTAQTIGDGASFQPRYPRFFLASVILSFLAYLAPVGLWLALKCRKDAVARNFGKGKATFAIVWAALFCLILLQILWRFWRLFTGKL